MNPESNDPDSCVFMNQNTQGAQDCKENKSCKVWVQGSRQNSKEDQKTQSITFKGIKYTEECNLCVDESVIDVLFMELRHRTISSS